MILLRINELLSVIYFARPVTERVQIERQKTTLQKISVDFTVK